MARKKDPAREELRKEKIFVGALQIIAKHGSQNVTLAQVAKAAGVSRGGITYYYSTKDELFRDVFTNFYKELFIISRERMEQHQDPLAQLLSFTWLFDEKEQVNMYMYPLMLECMGLATFDDFYRQLLHDMYDGWAHLLSVALRQGVEAKQFEVLEIEKTARMISSFYQGIANRWFLDRVHHSTQWAKDSIRRAIPKLLSS